MEEGREIKKEEEEGRRGEEVLEAVATELGPEREADNDEGRKRARVGALLRELGEVIGVEREAGAPRRPRSDAGKARLTWRDLRALRFIGEQYAITHEQLERLLALFGEEPARERVSQAMAYRTRARWARAGLAEARQVVSTEPPIVWLTARGRQLVELDVKSWRPSMNTIRHVPAVAEVRLYMERSMREGEWVSERLLAGDQAVGRRGVSAGQRPDAEWRYGDGQVLAVEVELSQKEEGRLRRVMRDRLERYENVWYFAPAEPPSLRALVERVGDSLYRERVAKARELRSGPGSDGERQERRIAALEGHDVVLRSLEGEELWSAFDAFEEGR